MSALGHKRTVAAPFDFVRYVPEADMPRRFTRTSWPSCRNSVRCRMVRDSYRLAKDTKTSPGTAKPPADTKQRTNSGTGAGKATCWNKGLLEQRF
jgi:hypothetical protein